jgi:hypothetical protein
MNQRHLLVARSAFVVALTSSAALAAPLPAPAPAGGTGELDFVNSASKAKAAALTSAQAAAKAREELASLATERKAVTGRIAESQRELKLHTTNGSSAAKTYDAALKAGKGEQPATAAALEKARGELTAAGAAGDAAVKDTKALRKLEESSGKKLGDVLDAAAAAKASADAAKAAKERLRQKASSDTSAAQKSAGSTASAASSASTAAGISPTGYAAKRLRAEADAQKLATDVRGIEQSLAALKAPAPPAATKRAALKQCDLRKVDWDKYFPSTSENTGDGTNEYGVVNVEYADLDGDGAVEALVYAMHSYLGLTASQRWELNVMTRDRDCTVSSAGTFTGALCAEMTRTGSVLTLNEGCEGFVAEYRLVQGSMKETKRRNQ